MDRVLPGSERKQTPAAAEAAHRGLLRIRMGYGWLYLSCTESPCTSMLVSFRPATPLSR
jgi:hypothetical protein